MCYLTNVEWFLRLARQIRLYWQRLMVSPAKSNKYFILELSRAWEPSDSLRVRGLNASTRSYSCVFSRNIVG